MPHVQMSDIVSMSLTIFAFSAPAACGTIEYMALRATIQARWVRMMNAHQSNVTFRREVCESYCWNP